MKAKLSIFISGLIMISLCGCGQGNKMNIEKIERGELGGYYDEELDALHKEKFVAREINIILNNYFLSEINECTEKSISGILSCGNNVFMVDADDDCIYVFNKQDEKWETLGVTGNGELEFLNPTGITEHDGEIYILDAENRRIQILNQELEYKGEIGFSEDMKQEVESLNSIAVDKYGNIYMASTYLEYGKVLCYKAKEKQFVELGSNFYGTVAKKEGEVYAINIGVKAKGKGSVGDGWRTGLNALYSVTTERMEMICELPYAITPSGFAIKEDGIVCVSGSYGTVDFYDFNGTYMYSYGYSEDIAMYCCLTMDEEGTIYVGVPFEKKVLKIEQME